MSKKKNNKININRKGDTMLVKVIDQTYRSLHKGTYQLKSMKDMYHLLTVIEKFSSFSIVEVINYEKKQSWV